MDGEGNVLAQGAQPQIRRTAGLQADWSRFVTEDGQQLQTVGHHLSLSRPLNNTERAKLEREGTCIACHEVLPSGDLAVSALHHVGSMLDALPAEPEAHSSLVNKIVRISAWAQVACVVLSLATLLVLYAFYRRRGRMKQAGDIGASGVCQKFVAFVQSPCVCNKAQ